MEMSSSSIKVISKMFIVYCYQKINSYLFFQIKAVHCKAGDKVGEGDIMVEIENHPDH